MVSRSISCEITTTKAGQLDSLLTAKAKEGGFRASDLTSLTISGPIMQADIDCIRDFKYIQTLDLTNAKIFSQKRVYVNGKYMYIPEEEIWGIPSDMFSWSDYPAEVLLPEHITYIEKKAFYNSSITSITIPDGVSNLGEYVFYQCKNLTKVKLPNKLVEIPEQTFDDCYALAEIELPSTLLSIGYQAFDDCHALTKINLPAGLRIIGDGAFWATGLTEVEIPESVTTIGENAFRKTKLSHLTIPETVKEIGADFVSWTPTLLSWDWPSTLHAIPDYAFAGCSNLEFEIPDHITSIGKGALWETGGLAKITIPESVTSIGDKAFLNCTMTSVAINGNPSLGDEVFSDCENLQEVEVVGTFPLFLIGCFGNAIA